VTKLQQLREAKGLSRAQLARRADLNAVTVGWVESGRFRPYPVQLRKLAKALGLPVAQAGDLVSDADAA
jgi:transcriptional regulator with XRE-family HTH domain